MLQLLREHVKQQKISEDKSSSTGISDSASDEYVNAMQWRKQKWCSRKGANGFVAEMEGLDDPIPTQIEH